MIFSKCVIKIIILNFKWVASETIMQADLKQYALRWIQNFDFISLPFLLTRKVIVNKRCPVVVIPFPYIAICHLWIFKTPIQNKWELKINFNFRNIISKSHQAYLFIICNVIIIFQTLSFFFFFLVLNVVQDECHTNVDSLSRRELFISYVPLDCSLLF